MTRVRLEKEERKKQIKEVALKLFIEKGLVKTTMDDIIEKMGISKGGVYYHYKNKEEIFSELIKDSMTYRKKLVVEYVSNNKGMSREELIMNMLLDKILDTNPYKTIYAIFLTELRSNKELTELYNRIYNESKEEFIQFCINENLPEYIPLTNAACDFFMNSLIVGSNILGNNDEAEVRDMLKVMLLAYLKHMSIL
ncbi:HTH-type transcriptional regulator AcrR [Anaerotignum neopropionicum]|uniref:HTH-type transcriptional regulator AcrR n=1 Tax=Anaerotignum neopropionicum TaxID=36847 RepID=A0A136WCK5_9FIRM|nr:TetR/AcrR family transcriptional regulator [Anaerotignum neopropionicum]KXL52220.1 HTH-type transcriptional regulator AcrR [Anaerotignum neopropionicum]